MPSKQAIGETDGSTVARVAILGQMHHFTGKRALLDHQIVGIHHAPPAWGANNSRTVCPTSSPNAHPVKATIIIIIYDKTAFDCIYVYAYDAGIFYDFRERAVPFVNARKMALSWECPWPNEEETVVSHRPMLARKKICESTSLSIFFSDLQKQGQMCELDAFNSRARKASIWLRVKSGNCSAVLGCDLFSRLVVKR